MQSVGGYGPTSGVRMLTSPSTQSAAGTPASSSSVSSTGQEGNGLTTPSSESAHSLLPPAARLYAESFGWPISVVDGDVTVSCGDDLDVTTMPAGFAGEVNQLLRVHLLMAPIVEMRAAETDESSTWAFFSRPKQPTRTDGQLLKLSACGVKHFGPGATFPLPPSPICSSEALSWRVPPPFGVLNTPLPPWESIVACALKVKYRSAGR
jgi:hypothetical protein